MSSREIKFRAWEKERGLMYQDWDDTGHSPAMRGKGGGVELGFALLSDEYDVMQYTGLKDKNGVEIYEGDILQGGLEQEVVEFVDGGFQPLTDDGFMFHAEHRLEVIGNIWENKDLLK